MGNWALTLAFLVGCGQPEHNTARVAEDARMATPIVLDSKMEEGPTSETPVVDVKYQPDNRSLEELIPLWAQSSDSVFVAHVDLFESKEIPDPPFVSTDVHVTSTTVLKGSAPMVMRTLGGRTNSVTVLAAHGPNIREGLSYLIFAQNDQFILTGLMRSPDVVILRGKEIEMSRVTVLVDASTREGATP
jgi:hypothetical protein